LRAIRDRHIGDGHGGRHELLLQGRQIGHLTGVEDRLQRDRQLGRGGAIPAGTVLRPISYSDPARLYAEGALAWIIGGG
jgi:hypothetical protein